MAIDNTTSARKGEGLQDYRADAEAARFSEREFREATDPKMVDLYNLYLRNPNAENQAYVFTEIAPRLGQRIAELVGFDASGHRLMIDRSGINHILNRHGPNGKADEACPVPMILRAWVML